MPEDRKQLLAPTRSAVVLAADLGLSEPHANLFPNPHSFPSKGQCGSSGLLLHDGIYSAAPFGWFGGMLWVCPLPSVGQWSEEEYQSCIEKGAGSGGWEGHVSLDRAGGHWACHMADGWFTTPVERWSLIDHLSLPPHTHTFHWQISFTACHLYSALTSVNINKLSLQSSHPFSQASAEAPVLIPAPANSAAAFHGLL